MATSLSASSPYRLGEPTERRRYDSILNDSEDIDHATFKSKIGTVLSCLGCVIGTGNLWRFPRIVANNAENKGGLAFLLVWLLFLLLWSIPMITIEYATGRYTHKGVVASFRELVGVRASWCGCWIAMVAFGIACYYSVILGWCFYYLYYCAVKGLPSKPEEGQKIFEDFAENSYWPILTTSIAASAACLCCIRGVRTIEKVCLVLVPLLLLILVFTFAWALTRPHSDLGIVYLFSPNWESLRDPRLWVDALSQNAFDTGAGAGLLVPYAAYMTRKHGIVKYATLIPSTNNLVSLIAGITIFSAVFSTMIVLEPSYTQSDIVNILVDSGPGNTGLTFIWLPVLFDTVGVLGRVVAVLFFLCLSFAGLTSLVGYVEVPIHTLEDWGVRRVYAVAIILCCTLGLGQLSATNINILTNQDFVWGFALIINGLMFMYLVYTVGTEVYREEMINDYGRDDWQLAKTWSWVIKYIAPVEAIALIVWWAIDLIITQPQEWYEISTETFMAVIVQWIGVMSLLIIGNVLAVYWWRRRKFKRSSNETSRLVHTSRH